MTCSPPLIVKWGSWCSVKSSFWRTEVHWPTSTNTSTLISNNFQSCKYVFQVKCWINNVSSWLNKVQCYRYLKYERDESTLRYIMVKMWQNMYNRKSCDINVHIQIPPTDYVGLILHSTAVATASRSTIEGTIRILWRYCDKRLKSYYTCSRVRVPS